MTVLVRICLGMAITTSLPAAAETRDRARQLDDMTACRAVAGDAARLACFDRTVAGFDEAEKRGDVVVVNREQISRNRHEQFGLPSGDGGLTRRPRDVEPPVANVESTLVSASQSYYKWTFALANGMRWRQTDSIGLVAPRIGSKVVVSRASMGSYFIRIGNFPVIRAVRLR